MQAFFRLETSYLIISSVIFHPSVQNHKCYVGQKKLNAAIDSFEQSFDASSSPSLSIEWKPYIIDPNTKTNGEEFEAYNIRRWGSSGWTHGLKRSGRKVGANFNNWKTWPNTLRAHQLIAYVTNPARKVENKKPTTSHAMLPSLMPCMNVEKMFHL